MSLKLLFGYAFGSKKGVVVAVFQKKKYMYKEMSQNAVFVCVHRNPMRLALELSDWSSSPYFFEKILPF